jgi:hypothetical protein
LYSFREFQFRLRNIGKSKMLTRKFVFAVLAGAFAFASICEAGAALRVRLDDSAGPPSVAFIVTDNNLGGSAGPFDSDPTLGRILVGGLSTTSFIDISIIAESRPEFGPAAPYEARLLLQVNAEASVAGGTIVVWAEDVYAVAPTTTLDSTIEWTSVGVAADTASFQFQSWGDDTGGPPDFGPNGSAIAPASVVPPAVPDAVEAWGPGEGTTFPAEPPGGAVASVGFVSDGGFYLASRIEITSSESGQVFTASDEQAAGVPPPPPPIPEPTSLVLLAGVFGAFGLAKKRHLLFARKG